MISLSSHAYRLWNQIAGARSSAGETNTLLAPTPHFFEQISGASYVMFSSPVDVCTLSSSICFPTVR